MPSGRTASTRRPAASSSGGSTERSTNGLPSRTRGAAGPRRARRWPRRRPRCPAAPARAEILRRRAPAPSALARVVDRATAPQALPGRDVPAAVRGRRRKGETSTGDARRASVGVHCHEEILAPLRRRRRARPRRARNASWTTLGRPRAATPRRDFLRVLALAPALAAGCAARGARRPAAPLERRGARCGAAAAAERRARSARAAPRPSRSALDAEPAFVFRAVAARPGERAVALSEDVALLRRRARSRSGSARGSSRPSSSTEAFLARIEAHARAPRLLRHGHGRARARRGPRGRGGARRGRWRGPLHGVPYGLKDLVDTAGIRTTFGARPYADRVPERDAADRDAALAQRARCCSGSSR